MTIIRTNGSTLNPFKSSVTVVLIATQSHSEFFLSCSDTWRITTSINYFFPFFSFSNTDYIWTIELGNWDIETEIDEQVVRLTRRNNDMKI